MKKTSLWLALALAATACQPPAHVPPPTAGATYLPGQVLVRFEPETDAAARAALRARYDAQAIETLPSGTERWHVSGLATEVAGALAREAGIKAAQPNWVRRLQAFEPQDVDYAGTASKQWHLLPDYLNMASVWSDYSTQSLPGDGITVAVVDSGVDLGHPDLVPNLVKNNAGTVQYIDLMPESGYAAPSIDGNGHGTHVTGIIAAASNTGTFGTGPHAGNAVGVAPGIKVLPVKVMRKDGGGDDFTIAKGLDEAVKWRHPDDPSKKVDLINLSIGGAEPSPTLAASLANAARNHVMVVAAAGNYNQPVYYPAAYPGALAVGALNPQNTRAGYSCYGPQLALVAPGGADPQDASESKNGWSGIYATFPTYANYSGKLYYGAQSGTSMAAPVVSGIAALVLAKAKSQGQALTPDQLRMRLVATADDIGDPGFDNLTGWGKLNPRRALDWVKHDGSTP